MNRNLMAALMLFVSLVVTACENKEKATQLGQDARATADAFMKGASGSGTDTSTSTSTASSSN